MSDKTLKGNYYRCQCRQPKKPTRNTPNSWRSSRTFPTLPVVAMKVNELINDPNSSGADIAEVMKKDQVLTAKVLRLVNSSYYAIPGGVADVQRALAFLGFNTVAQLVLSLSVFSVFSTRRRGFPDARVLAPRARHRRLQRASGQTPEDRQIRRSVHLRLASRRRQARAASDRSGPADGDRAEAKRARRLRRSRARVGPAGAFVLGEVIATKWGLPQVIRLAIRYHHFDVSQMGSVLASAKPVIHIVRLANPICVKNQIGHSGDCSEGKITPDMLKHLDLKDGYPAHRRAARQRHGKGRGLPECLSLTPVATPERVDTPVAGALSLDARQFRRQVPDAL